MKAKKISFASAVFAVILTVVLAVGFLTDTTEGKVESDKFTEEENNADFKEEEVREKLVKESME